MDTVGYGISIGYILDMVNKKYENKGMKVIKYKI